MRAVTFDAYGTLVRLDQPFERLAHGLARVGPPVPLEIVERCFLVEMHYYKARHMEGATEERLARLRRRCAGVLFEALDAAGYPRRLDEEAQVALLLGALRFRLYEDALPILEHCLRSGLKTAVISNWDCDLPRVLGELLPGHPFDGVFVSAIEGLDKSGPGLFWRAAAALDLPSEAILHIGDDPLQDAQAAREAGFQALWLDRQGARGTHEQALTSLLEARDLLP